MISHVLLHIFTVIKLSSLLFLYLSPLCYLIRASALPHEVNPAMFLSIAHHFPTPEMVPFWSPGF